MNTIFSTILLLLITMDPLGNLPIFISVLKKIEPKKRIKIIIREMVIALFLMLNFLFFGERILLFFNIYKETILVSSGIVLFLVSTHMIFPNFKNKNNAFQKNEEPFIIPLAIPLVFGPSVFITLVLLSNQYPNQLGNLIIALLVSWVINLVILSQSFLIFHFFGEKKISILEKMMGLVLAMLSIQMFLDGIQRWIKG